MVALIHRERQGRSREVTVFEDWDRSILIQPAEFGGQLFPFGLVPSILEPDFHLGFSQLQVLGQVGSFGGRQVLLEAELPFEFYDLSMGEGSSGSLEWL